MKSKQIRPDEGFKNNGVIAAKCCATSYVAAETENAEADSNDIGPLNHCQFTKAEEQKTDADTNREKPHCPSAVVPPTSGAMKHTSLTTSLCGFVFVMAAGLRATGAATDNSPDDWPYYGHDAGGMRYSPLTQINRDNAPHSPLLKGRGRIASGASSNAGSWGGEYL